MSLFYYVPLVTVGGLDSQVGIQTNLDHNSAFFTQLIAGTLTLFGLSIPLSVEWGHLFQGLLCSKDI